MGKNDGAIKALQYRAVRALARPCRRERSSPLPGARRNVAVHGTGVLFPATLPAVAPDGL